ncbi:syntaxin-8 [Octopus sinensis]|uniref:Syntaxin-8 n=1 Tax=Octopus sinensis TaxID=2607531 RepID=A0A7E6F272_9MOLL|nr:syntaxin-8 [Octopus sinensis]
MPSDPWMSKHDSCAKLGHELFVELNKRDKHPRTSSAYTKLNSQIRTSMKKFSSDVAQLKPMLIQHSASHRLTQREVERRQIMIDELSSKQMKLELAFRNEGDNIRQNLMSSPPTSRPATNPWLDEPEEFQNMGNQNLRTHQQRVIAQQDEGLDALSRVISHQKQMAVDIGNECDTQNEIIDDIGDHMDKINERLIKETRHIKIVDKKSNTCCKSDFFLFFCIFVFMFVKS